MQTGFTIERGVAELPRARTLGDVTRQVTGLSYDSRRVRPGDLFVCVRGLKTDGHRFAADAVRRGAVAVLGERRLDLAGIPQVIVPDSRQAMALWAAAFHGHPSRRLGMIGVTGTNGKTTTAHLIEAVLAAAGMRTGLIGTVEIRSGDRIISEPRSTSTTPESADLQRLLAGMAADGVRHVSMEVSSHALDLRRVDGVEFDFAVLTNVSRDHFDFHPDFPSYLAAKTKLFQSLGRAAHKPGPKTAVINADDPHAGHVAAHTPARVVTFGLGPADVRALDVELQPLQSTFTVQAPAAVFRVELGLPGLFNVSNALAAIAVGLSAGIAPETIARALSAVRSIPGRYEVIDCGQPFTVIVDFAHNPDALANILRIPVAGGGRKLIVFGAEGGKDRGKRPLMGEIAMRHSDLAIVTSDNIYDEDPHEIARQVARGAGVEAAQDGAGRKRYEVIIERRAAIARALELARPGDLVVIAGKGHETYQEMGGWKRPFDDREVVRELLRERSHV